MKKIILLKYLRFFLCYNFIIVATWSLRSQTLLWTEDFSSSVPTGWATINAGSGNNWVANSTTNPYNGSYCATYPYHSTNSANAWLFTTAVNMSAGSTYRIEFYQRVRSASYPEKLKVTVGNGQTVASQTVTLYDNNNLTNTTYTNRVSTDFIPSTSGTYYFGFNCYSAANMYDLHIDNVRVYESTPPTPAFSNFPTGTGAIAFNTCRSANSTPVFAVTMGGAANRVVIELNTNSSFTGTAYTSTISGSYSASTKYDIVTTTPIPVGTYFCRVKSSNNGGSTWTSYSSDLWVYTYDVAPYGFHHTAKEQFDTPNSSLAYSTTSGWDNFISTSDNSTANNASDDYFLLGQGSSSVALSSNSDQYLTEGSSNYSGASYSFLTIGSYYLSGQLDDYQGFRFQNPRIPNACTILSASLTAFAHHTGGEPSPSNSNPLYLKIRGADQDNCNAWANSTNSSTGDPKNRTRTTAGTTWTITSTWSDLSAQISPDIKTLIQPIVSRAGYNPSTPSAIGVIVDYDGSSHSSANRHRYFATGSRGTAYRGILQTTFNDFYNELSSPSFSLASVYGATQWDKLYFTNDETGCGSCDITYYVYNASTNALIASGGTSPINLGSAASSVYVTARIYRSNTGTFTPKGLDFTLTVNSSILPVDLISFIGNCDKNKKSFSWSTLSEKNNKVFVIEKSIDGITYIEDGKVAGNNNSSNKKDYHYTSPNSNNEYVYFRLKQEDFDGNFKYFKALYLSCEDGENASTHTNIFPNPTSGILNISSDKMTPGINYEIQIFDLLGKLIHKISLSSEYRLQLLPIDVSGLNNNIYLITISNPQTGEVIEHTKFVKE